MAEGNGELLDDINQKADDRGDGERTEDYPKLLEYGLDKKVSALRTQHHMTTITNICHMQHMLLGRRQTGWDLQNRQVGSRRAGRARPGRAQGVSRRWCLECVGTVPGIEPGARVKQVRLPMRRDEDVPTEESSQPTGRGRARNCQRSRRGQDQENPRAHRLHIRCDDRWETFSSTGETFI